VVLRLNVVEVIVDLEDSSSIVAEQMSGIRAGLPAEFNEYSFHLDE